MTKTNAIRILESRGIPFETRSYVYDQTTGDAVSAAQAMGVEAVRVFKTLVAVGEPGRYVVFCIPADAVLDRKKAAAAAGFRGVDLVSVKDLFGLTGYVRGGCSPIGMKKPYPVYIDEIATALDWILVNGGSRGLQVKVDPAHLAQASGAVFADLV